METGAGERELEEPPQQVRMRYYLWDVRVPPTWLPWVERDIRSASWLWRELARFLLAFLVLAAVAGRLRITVGTVACLVLGVSAIVAGRHHLRRVALAYQRYGSDWPDQGRGVAPYVRVAFAILFTVVFLLLAL
ncbi:MAG TPA: hypothetical protein VM840_12980 [Actinomycetota bacterium]|nr:hypothetical protein [Actinomycetota bacterium]